MQSARLIVLAISLLPVAGCKTSDTATDAAKVAAAIGTIEPSRNDTCGTLRQIAAQTSRIKTIETGKEVVVKAPNCTEGTKNAPVS